MLANAIKKRLNKEEGQKGFTLIELLAVIVILGIIAVIAIPMIGGIIDNTKGNSDNATARQVYEAARLYILGEKNGNFTAANVTSITLDNLQDNKYLDEPLYLPSTKTALTSIFVNFNTDGTLTDVTGEGVAHSGYAVSIAAGSVTVNLTAAQVLKAEN